MSKHICVCSAQLIERKMRTHKHTHKIGIPLWQLNIVSLNHMPFYCEHTQINNKQRRSRKLCVLLICWASLLFICSCIFKITCGFGVRVHWCWLHIYCFICSFPFVSRVNRSGFFFHFDLFCTVVLRIRTQKVVVLENGLPLFGQIDKKMRRIYLCFWNSCQVTEFDVHMRFLMGFRNYRFFEGFSVLLLCTSKNNLWFMNVCGSC